MESIYLDHNATTPTRPEVVEAMARCYGTMTANPASQHRPGQQARRALDDAREQIAEILGADLAPPRRDRLVLTSGGTEANNLAILGIARASRPNSARETAGVEPGTSTVAKKGDRRLATTISSGTDVDRLGASPLLQQAFGPPAQIIISAGEHQSVIEPAEHLLEEGWRLDTLGLTTDGLVQVEQLPPLLGPQTRLVSVLLGNHETGVLQPVAELAAICQRAGVPLHTDAVQVVGKLPVNFRGLGVAAMSIAAHKFQGPLGIGALLVRNDVPLTPLMFGGHQQSGLRPGTESAALAVGMATALGLWQKEQDQHAQRLQALRDRFESGLREGLGNVVVHGAKAARLPQTTSVALLGLDGQVLLMALDLAGVACSVGSACASGSTELSPTLRAMGVPNEQVAASLRFSFGATTTEAEIDEALRRIVGVCRDLRG